jgi:hypothetical protein
MLGLDRDPSHRSLTCRTASTNSVTMLGTQALVDEVCRPGRA